MRYDMQSAHANPGVRLNLLLTDGGWRDESWADRLPRLLSPMGVEARRAQSGSEAADLLDNTRIHAAIVDLTLPMDARVQNHHAQRHSNASMPSEGGARLLKLLARVKNPPPIIVVREPRMSREDARDLYTALQHGVFAVVDRPVNMELMLEVLRRLLTRYYHGRWPEHG
ncbi:MAG: hypothetical protein ACYTF7_11235 [Planctomycetota bacterium]